MMPDAQLSTVGQEKALERVLADLLDALARGEPVDLPAWQSRYPLFAADLAELCAAYREINGALRADETIVQAPDRTKIITRKDPTGEAPLGRVGDYELLEELGHGGMGRVYKARQRSLGRLVALKMVRLDRPATDVDRLRFRTEAEAAARLDHPNIVPVYEVGEYNGQPYLAIRYVSGGSLRQHLDRFRDEPLAAAALIATLAKAVHHAHERGVLHRDLKPGNVLLEWPAGPSGTPIAHVADFGLARLVDQDSGLTRTGDMVGTPSYMAPEQASGGTAAITTASDIYGLGAILYAVLTGRPPFIGGTVLDTLEQVRHREPEPPRRLNPKVSRDLETICLKCLRKESGRRYASAWELAEDLRRLQMQEPISARPTSPAERLVLWTKRRPALAAVYGLASLVLLLGGLGGTVTWLWYRSEEARIQLAGEKRQSEEARRQTEEARQRLAEVSYYHKVGLAYREWQDAEISRARQFLNDCSPQRRGWEWHYVNRLCHAELLSFNAQAGPVSCVAFSKDGRRLATASADRTIRIWNSATGEQLLALRGHTGAISSVVFSADGQYLASGSYDKTVRIWSATTGQKLRTCLGHTSLVRSVCFSPDGTRLASASADKTVRLWNQRTGALLRVFTRGAMDTHNVAFSPDGQFLASCGGQAREGELQVWNWKSGAKVLCIKHSDGLTAVAFSPDGRHVAAACVDKQVRIWDVATGRELVVLHGHQSSVNTVAFSPDGRLLASGSSDKTARVWDVRTGEQIVCHRGHLGGVGSVAFSPDSRLLATASNDVKLWRATDDARVTTLHGHTGSIQEVRMSPDGRLIMSGSADGTIRVWDIESQRPRKTIHAHATGVSALSPSPDGQHIASGGEDGLVKIWNLQTGEATLTLGGHPEAVQDVAYSPDGRRLASASGIYQGESGLVPGEVKVWDAATGRLLLTLGERNRRFHGVAWSPDGKRLACGGRGVVAVVDSVSGQQLLSWPAHDSSVIALAYSPDGQRLATASPDKTLKVWDATTATRLFAFRGHTQGINCLAFSPDGQRIATGGDDQTVRIIAAATGDETFSLKGHLGPIHSLTFSPDGQRLITGGWDHLVRVWDARPVVEPGVR